MKLLKNTWSLFVKDILLELRTKITFTSVILFSFLVLLIFNFSFKLSAGQIDTYAAGILWITVSFAGVLALARIFDHEKIRWPLKGVMTAPLDRLSIFLSKFMIHFTFMFLIEIICLSLFIFLYNPAWGLGIVFKIMAVFLISSVGFSSLGVLVTSMLFNERLKDLLLPLLFYPLIIPLIILGVKTTNLAIDGGSLSLLIYIGGYDLIFFIASGMLYEYILEGD